MGAQAAALLASGALGDVPPPRPVRARFALAAPPAYDLRRTALGHAGVGLAPSAYAGGRLHRTLALPDAGAVPVAVDAGLVATAPVALTAADERAARRQLTTVLCLDDDLTELHDACDAVPELRWVRPAGAGRSLRSPTAFEDLVGALAATGSSYAAAQHRVRALVGEGAFPGAEDVARRGEAALRALGWGYRAPRLAALSRQVADVDLEAWRDPLRTSDEQVLRQLRALPGIGPFAAAQVLPLLGHRPRPPVLDGWLREQLGDRDPARWAPMGRWAGTGRWLAVAARWLR